MRIRSLLLSPAHIYFGHHGLPPGKAPMVAVDRVQCIAGRGLQGDRFFDHKTDYKGQITFFSGEALAALRRELALAGADPALLRRNVVTEGADLGDLIGAEFELQGIHFLGTEECRPCHWMNQAVAPGAEAWLKGRGGLRARILSDGWLACDAAGPARA